MMQLLPGLIVGGGLDNLGLDAVRWLIFLKLGLLGVGDKPVPVVRLTF